MKNSWKVAQWEILRNLTNKQFIIGLLITPLIMALFIVVPVLLERWNQPATTTYYVVDELGPPRRSRPFCLKTSCWKSRVPVRTSPSW